jgi:arylsulfatase A-like enzyme
MSSGDSDPTRRKILTGTASLAACSVANSTPGNRRGLSPSDTGEKGASWVDTADTALPHSAPGQDRPNVLIVFPDQLRQQALSVYGETNIQTPCFDRICQQGAAFTHAVTPSPVCTPARAALWTGLYPYATGTSENGAALPEHVPSIAHSLRDLGYTANYIGKWHLAGDYLGGWVRPHLRAGFVDYFAGRNMGHDYLSSQYWTDEHPEGLRPDPVDTWEPIYETQLAIDFLESKRKEGPWLLALSWSPPHPNGNWPVDWRNATPESLMERVDLEGLRFRDNVPQWIKEPSKGQLGYRDPYGARIFLQGYYASILGLDDQMARLEEALRAFGSEQDTLVVFTSDHGEMAGSHGRYKKGNWYEESVRVPLSFRWPGTIPPRELSTPSSLLDIFPTVLGLVDGVPEVTGHGRDLSALVRDDQPLDESVWTGSYIARKEEGPNQRRALRTRTWKLGDALYYPELNVLFNLEEDPMEQNNLYFNPDYAEIREALELELLTHRIRTEDPELS